MTTIYVRALDQVLEATISPRIASGNRETVFLRVEFSEHWNGFAKSAVFYTSKNPVPFSRSLSVNGLCTIPAEVLADECRLFISVQGVNSSTGAIKATLPVKYKVDPGAPPLVISDPTPDVYQELLTAYGNTVAMVNALSLANEQAIAVERARIDVQLALEDGSTTGDAELQDIRVGVHGETYESAGTAVRLQARAVADVLSHLGIYDATKYTKDGDGGDEIAEMKGCIDTSGVFLSTSAWFATDFIDIRNAVSIKYYLVGVTTVSNIAFYDSAKSFISGVSTDTDYHAVKGIADIPGNAAFVRFTFMYSAEGQYALVEKANTDMLQNPLHGKIITATGDSITAATASAPNGNFVKLIADKNAMEYENVAIWGAVTARNVNADGNVLESILDTIDTMRTDADYIILSGGINDYCYIQSGEEPFGEVTIGHGTTFDENTYCGAFESMLRKAILKWPGKKILFVVEHKMIHTNSTVGLLIESTYLPATLAMLEKWGVPYVDLYHDAPPIGLVPELRDAYTWDGNGDGIGDGWHPTEKGYSLYYAPAVEAKLKSI